MKMKTQFVKLDESNRLHGLSVPVIGLTGGIATGKSTVSKLLQKEGVPVIDADQLVKGIYRQTETKNFIHSKCPEAIRQGEIHFETLREHFFSDKELKAEIEKFIYARLPEAFQDAYKKLGSPDFVVYDVPLLYEKHLENKVDLVVLVYAPRKIQRARLIVRDGSTEALAEAILMNQLDIEDKKLKANYIIDNSQTEAELDLEVKNFISKVLST